WAGATACVEDRVVADVDGVLWSIQIAAPKHSKAPMMLKCEKPSLVSSARTKKNKAPMTSTHTSTELSRATSSSEVGAGTGTVPSSVSGARCQPVAFCQTKTNSAITMPIITPMVCQTMLLSVSTRG